MGAWGAAIFESDLACDVRDALSEATAMARSTEEAVQRVLDGFGDSLDDPDEADEVWIALAASLADADRLTDAVRQRALDAIDSGRVLSLWEETPGGVRARGKALEKLRAALMASQGSPKNRRRRETWVAPFATGDILRIATPNPRAALAFVADTFADNGGRYNAIRLLRKDNGVSYKAEEFLGDPIDSVHRAVPRDFLVGGKTVPSEIVRVAQGVRPPEASLRPPHRIETWNGGWRIDLVGIVTSWQALPIWTAAFLDDRVLEPPFPV